MAGGFDDLTQRHHEVPRQPPEVQGGRSNGVAGIHLDPALFLVVVCTLDVRPQSLREPLIVGLRSSDDLALGYPQGAIGDAVAGFEPAVPLQFAWVHPPRRSGPPSGLSAGCPCERTEPQHERIPAHLRPIHRLLQNSDGTGRFPRPSPSDVSCCDHFGPPLACFGQKSTFWTVGRSVAKCPPSTLNHLLSTSSVKWTVDGE